MRKEIVIKRILEVMFVCSAPCMTLLVLHSGWGNAGYLASLALSVILAAVFAEKVVGMLLEELHAGLFLTAAAAALYTSYNYSLQGNAVYIINQNREKLSLILSVLHSEKRLVAGLILASFPAIGLFFYFILRKTAPYLAGFFRSLDRAERRFLLGSAILGAAAVAAVYLNTSVCYYGENSSGPVLYDMIYTTDCTEIFVTDSYMHVFSGPNDIRQPLFGLFALPVALICKAAAAVLFFLPELLAYGMALAVAQIVLLAVTVVLLWRMLKLEGKERAAFAAFLICSYTYLLYGFLIEQYVLAYFYVILAVYAYQRTEKINYAYFGAVSTLITSGVLFPLLVKERKLKKWMTGMMKCLALYFCIVIWAGQLPQFLGMKKKLTDLMMFTGGEISWYDKWVQFTNFLRDMFWSPAAELGTFNHYQFKIIPSDSVSLIGLAILVCTAAGFALNHKELMARIAAGWVALSILVLFLVGWGTAENGLILYALYFAWAYMVLLYGLIRRLIPSAKVRSIVLAAISLVLLVHNGYGLFEIYQFGVRYYPQGW